MARYLFTNGTTITMEREGDLHEACAVIDGMIAGVGTMSDMKTLLGSDYAEIDMHGGALLPGFTDCHIHMVLSTFFTMNLDLAKIGSIEELTGIIRDRAEKGEPGKWLMGMRFREDDYIEGRMPTLSELDEAAPENPLVLLRYDGHSALVNSLALKAAGITMDTPDPEGGVIEKRDGRLTGVLKELAMQPVISAMPIPEMEEFRRGFMSFVQRLLSYGIVCVHNIMQTGPDGPSGDLGPFEIPIFKLFEADVPIRSYPMIAAPSAAEAVTAVIEQFGGKKKDGRIRGGALKIFSDGTFGSRTAYFTEDYHDQPGERGMLVNSLETLEELVFSAQEEGIQVAVHAIGDRGVSEMVDIFLKAREKFGKKGLRHRIEHAGMIAPELFPKIRDAELILSFQPSFIVSEGSWMKTRVGDRLGRVYPIRSAIDAGIPVCGGSDSPIEEPNVMAGVWGTVVREGFTSDQALSVFEALSLYTRRAAFASFQEGARGTISPGLPADLVVLDRNPLTTKPSALRDIKVMKTVIDGETVWKR
jgi:predicted amidohydrolase YtcJ